MKNRLQKTALLLLALVLGAAFAPARPASAQEVLRARLHNGLRVIIVRNPLVPVVSTVVNYLVGADETPPGFPGMAHAQEHMMFRGSPGLSADQLARISAEMGGDFDADTQQNVTQYFFTVPADDLDLALHIESIRMRGVLDSGKLWDKERGAIEQEVASDLSNPEYVYYKDLLKILFAGTSYERDALGTRPSFDKTTGAMLKKFHDKWYAPNNAVLVICGDINVKSTLKKVKKLFGGIPARKLPEKNIHIALKPVKPTSLNLKTDRPYGQVSLAFRMPGYDSPDFAASVILSDALSSQRWDLYRLVAHGKALFTYFAVDPHSKAGLGYVVAGFPAGADSAKLMAEMKSALAGAIKNGVPADLVEAAKLHEITDAEFDKNSVNGLAMSWSQAVAVEGRHSPDDDINAIRKVTVADVNRVAAKYLDLAHSVQAVLTPEVSGKPVASHGFGGKESFAPGKPAKVKLPGWAKKAIGRLVIPHSALNPVVSVLPNGIRLVVQPEAISNTVSVYGRIKSNSDMQSPKGQKGVARVLSQLFSYGTKNLSRVAFQKALDDIGAEESAGTDFGLKAVPGKFDRGVQLLADNELNPALPESAFEIVRRQAAASAAGELQSPDHLAGQALKAGLFPKTDPSLRQDTPKAISALTINEVKKYYSSVFRPDMTTIVVIGKITPEDAKKVISKYFGNWQASGRKPDTDLPAVPNNKPAFLAVPDASRVQDNVTMALAMRLTRKSPDYYTLELGNNVLGGSFYATRLYKDLRENTGLVYYVGSQLEAGKNRSVYFVYFACDPDKVGRAAAIVRRDLRQMGRKDVPPAELRQAKAILLRRITLAESSVDRIAAGILDRLTNGLPVDEPVRAAKKYLKLKGPAIRKAFANWIHPDDMVQVVKGPQPK